MPSPSISLLSHNCCSQQKARGAQGMDAPQVSSPCKLPHPGRTWSLAREYPAYTYMRMHKHCPSLTSLCNHT